MIRRFRVLANDVHCRIGSSESVLAALGVGTVVHCRIGSSESLRSTAPVAYLVHCRIGSSEKPQ